MASLNRVYIIGNLGQGPELRRTANGTAVTTMNVATHHVHNDHEGTAQETTEWHRVVVWGRQAELCSQFLDKGRLVFIEGRLQTRSWDDAQGQKRYTTEIVAQNVQFLGQVARDQTASPPAEQAEREQGDEGAPAAPPAAAKIARGGRGRMAGRGNEVREELPF